MKCGCKWFIKLSQAKKEQRCKISDIHATHTNGCSPSGDQLVQVKTAAGDYAKCTIRVIEQLVNYLTCGKHPDQQYGQALLRKALPHCKCIHPRDVWNTRIRAKMLIRDIKRRGESIEIFNLRIKNPTDLVKPLDDLTDDILDDTLVCAEEVFSEFINDDSCNSKIFAILEKLGRKDGFTYNIAYDNSGKVTGIVWMTSVMRSNFERYSSSICLDAMKRKTNINLWPYMAIALAVGWRAYHTTC